MGLYAVLATTLPLIIQLIGVVTILFIATRQLLQLSRTRTLVHQDDKQIWIEKSVSESETHGMLIPAGYRSAGLLILVLQLDDDRYHRIVIWRDSVSSRQFSYLHHQLAFATTPARRNLRGADR